MAVAVAVAVRDSKTSTWSFKLNKTRATRRRNLPQRVRSCGPARSFLVYYITLLCIHSLEKEPASSDRVYLLQYSCRAVNDTVIYSGYKRPWDTRQNVSLLHQYGHSTTRYLPTNNPQCCMVIFQMTFFFVKLIIVRDYIFLKHPTDWISLYIREHSSILPIDNFVFSKETIRGF